jgi:hypothetical protein
MKRLALTFAACVLVTSCNERTEPPTTPRAVYTEPQFPPVTYTLYAIVRDETGAPLPGATAEVSEIRGAQTTNLAGYFAFSGLRGQTTVRVWRDFYEFYQKDLIIVGDTAIEIRLAKTDFSDFSDRLVIGRTIRSFVPASAEPCDPLRWDARSPCRKFFYTATAPGVLEVSIAWSGKPELDATITTTQGVYVGTSNGPEGTIRVLAQVSAGVTYEVRVNSYYDFQQFSLRAELRP